jgi:hypothetical protein
LPFDHIFGVAGFPFGQHFADADDRGHAGGDGRTRLLIDGGVGLAIELPPLGMADYHVRTSDVPEHRGGDLAGMSAKIVLDGTVLAGDMDI